MTKQRKKELQQSFFKLIGPNAEAFVSLFDRTDDFGFYIKDTKGRIIAINRRNREICNIRDEWEAIGLTSADLFSADKAADYMKSDLEVLRTGKPSLNVRSEYPADDSRRNELRDVYPLRSTTGEIIGTVCAYRLTAESKSATDRYKNMRAVSDYIQSHYNEPLRLSDLARMAGMSERSLNTSFHEIFSATPGHYIITTRLNAARQLLEGSKMSLTDIALECGFTDQSHFCRIFKKERGITPGAYRDQWTKSDRT